MIQNIGEHVFNNEFEIKEPAEKDFVLVFKNNKVLLKNEGEIKVPAYSEIKDYINTQKSRFVYLLKIDDSLFFLLENENTYTENDAFTWNPLQVFRGLLPREISFAAITGSQLARWYKNHRFCGCCGKPMIKSTMERAMVCDNCGTVDYPKISPAVIVGVIDGDRIVMTRYKGRSFKKYALIAGFNEIGESLEETVRREVLEEVGLKVKNIRYYSNQPWAFSDTLLVGFFAELDGDDKIVIEEDELSEGGWFKRDEIPEDEENSISLTYTMMKAFMQGKENEYCKLN